MNIAGFLAPMLAAAMPLVRAEIEDRDPAELGATIAAALAANLGALPPGKVADILEAAAREMRRQEA